MAKETYQTNAIKILLERRKSENVTVPPRTDSLLEPHSNTGSTKVTSQPHDVIEPSHNDLMTAESKGLSHNTTNEEARDHKVKMTQRLNDVIVEPESDLIRNTVRLDKMIDTELRRVCAEERITKETFLEAAYVLLKEHSPLMQQVIADAQHRLRIRRKQGEHRRNATAAAKASPELYK